MMEREPTRRRRAAERRGRRAERLVALWLSLQGWRILDRRARTAAGEIDLVARRGRVLAFVEVKRRAAMASAAEAVSPRQRARLLRAAALWRAARPDCSGLEPRFDVMLTAPWRPPRHLPGAFRAEGEDAARLL
ncbi:YraN family protein [Marinicauda salina]